MDVLRTIFLMERLVASEVEKLAHDAGLCLALHVARTSSELEEAAAHPWGLLLSFGTSVIVPESILCKPGVVALNAHSAPPSYPGRDPHHFATYDGVGTYGATLHFMTKSVDAGKIVDVQYFPVAENTTPVQLLRNADIAALGLIRRLFEKIRIDGLASIDGRPELRWGPRKTTRKDFRELCEVDATMGESEFSRRLRATQMPGFDNLVVKLFGQTFRIEGQSG